VTPRAPAWLGAERLDLEECASTNDLALVHARAGAAHGTVIIADRQSAGRGRLGRTWASPPGTNLYLSAIVRAPRPLAELAPLTLALGIGVVDAVRAEGVAAQLKWPNDVLVGTRKLAGILCEACVEPERGSRADSVVVAGIGVNVNVRAADLPDEVAARATSIADQRGAPIDRAAFTLRLLATLELWIDRFLAGGVAAIAPAWEARLATGLTLRAGALTGTALGLDRDGALRLRDDHGVIHRIHAGDVEAT
jgi:BirA family biotin operon repressor/biotin-[acetyl-CoA-carboxylase] ligase